MALSLALAYFALDKFVFDPVRDAAREDAVARRARSEALVESYGEKSIAVLPFVNLSSDAEQEYFSDGISEELLNLLAKIPELRVISRSSAFSFKGKDVKLAEIAETLNVAHVLEGSVRKSGERIRITAQLIDARSDTHLWSETYDRTLDDIFAIQDEIAAAVVAQLKLTLLGNPPRAKRADPQAYAMFLQARQLLGDSSDYPQVHQLLQQALERDPDYSLAWTQLGRFYYHLSDDPEAMQEMQGILTLSVEEAQRRSRGALEKALSFDPDNAMALAYQAYLAAFEDRDLAAGARLFARALTLDPTNPDVLQTAGVFARSLGRHEVAIALLERAVDRDPLLSRARHNLASAYRDAGRFDKAESAFRTLIAFGRAEQYSLGIILLLKDDPQAALEAFTREGLQDDVFRLQGQGLALHDLGRQAESDAVLEQLRSLSRERSQEADATWLLAQAHAWTGDADAAFEWLDRALELSDSADKYVLRDLNHPLFGKLYTDPRWHALLTRYGLAPEQLATIEFDVKLPR